MDTLHRLLDRCQPFAPEYAAGLSTHLPMALQALHALGADDATLERFHARGAARLPRREAAPALHSVAPEQGLGVASAFEPLRRHHERALARDGRDAVLREALGRLGEGVATRAFHGVIRVAHALDAGHDAELASALAYWTSRHEPLRDLRAPAAGLPDAPDAPSAPDAADATDAPCGPGAMAARHAWREALHALPPPPRPLGRLIADRVRAWAQVPGALATAGRWPVGAHPARAVHALAGEAAALYRDSGDFTVLHVVTGSRATWRLLGHAPDPTRLARHLAVAAGLALCASGVDLRTRPPAAAPAGAAPGWDDVVAAALGSHDEHVVKLVAACRELAWEGDPGGVFRAAAARAVEG